MKARGKENKMLVLNTLFFFYKKDWLDCWPMYIKGRAFTALKSIKMDGLLVEFPEFFHFTNGICNSIHVDILVIFAKEHRLFI